MAYTSANMRLIGGYPGQQLFMYKTSDAETTTDDSGYFDDAVDDYNLTSDDIILCVNADGGSETLAIYVMDVSSGTASVADDAVT